MQFTVLCRWASGGSSNNTCWNVRATSGFVLQSCGQRMRWLKGYWSMAAGCCTDSLLENQCMLKWSPYFPVAWTNTSLCCEWKMSSLQLLFKYNGNWIFLGWLDNGFQWRLDNVTTNCRWKIWWSMASRLPIDGWSIAGWCEFSAQVHYGLCNHIP